MQIDTKEITEKAKKYSEGLFLPMNIISFGNYLAMNNRQRMEYYSQSLAKTNEEFQRYKKKVIRSNSNNWLRMHGEPLRRGKENELHKRWRLD